MLRRGWLSITLGLMWGCVGPTVGMNAQISISPSPLPPILNQGNVSTVIGPASNLTALAMDEHDRLYVGEGGTVRRFSVGSGRWPRALGAGEVVMQGLFMVWAIAVAPDGAVWALDGRDQVFRQAPGQALASWRLPPSSDLLSPGLAVDRAGNAYVSINRPTYREEGDGEHYIVKVTPDGVIAPFVGQPGAKGAFVDGTGAAARFYGPGALTFDGAGNMYVADRGNMAIRRITPSGAVSTVAGKGRPVLPPSPMPGMPSPDLAPVYEGTVPVVGLTVDPMGNLYFTAGDNRVHRVTPDGVQSVFAGDGKICLGPRACTEACPSPEPDPCDRDGSASTARFFLPSTIVSDRQGVLYVLDRETLSVGYRVRRLD